jgi:aquaporin Z
VNPARSTAVALFTGDWAIMQLWLFWLAPLIGASLAAIVYQWMGSEDNGDQIAKPESKEQVSQD